MCKHHFIIKGRHFIVETDSVFDAMKLLSKKLHISESVVGSCYEGVVN